MSLAATRSGTGPPLLLRHGIGSAHQDRAGLLPHLTPAFDVLTVDLLRETAAAGVRPATPLAAAVA